MDSSTSKPFQQEKNALLARNKMPSELLAKVQPENDFTTQFKDMQKMNYDYAQVANTSYYPLYQYPTSYYESYGAQQESYQTDFPRAENYNSYFSIIETFPHLEGINDPNFDVESISPEAQFYIIRSGCDDNIHKAIKYHIWTSTINGKAILRNAWKNFLDRNLEPEIYLIFTVVNSNQFLGVAKMTSDINNDETFMYWWEPCKWFGTFQLQWLFIKDIHHQNFVHIREGPDNTLIINFKDSSPLSAKTGKIILEIFKRHPTRPNVFDSFEFMDMREDQVRAHRDEDEEFQAYFAEWCDSCKNDVRNTNPDWKPDAKKPRQNKGYYEKRGHRSHKKKYQGNRNSKFDDESGQYNEEVEYKLVKGKNEGVDDRKNRAGLNDLKDFPKLSEANDHQPKNKRSQDENSQFTSNVMPN